MSKEQDTESCQALTSSGSCTASMASTSKRLERGLFVVLSLAVLTILTLMGLLVFILANEQHKKDDIFATPDLIEEDQHRIFPTLPPYMAQRVSSIMAKKMEEESEKFLERYPRDHRYVAKQMLKFLPRPMELELQADMPDDEIKATEIFDSVDENENECADPWELHDWMIYVESLVHKFILDEQWHSLGQNDFDNLTWPDYVFAQNPSGLYTTAKKRKFKRDRRRWVYADSDKDDILSKIEFKSFLFPELSTVWVPEAHDEMDSDYDGRVSEKEFLSMDGIDVDKMSNYFRATLDYDKNGYLDLEEISQWLDPKGFIRAKSEVVYLLERMDLDKSKDLSLPEILNNTDLFLASQITYFGQIYQLKNLREKVFRFENDIQ